MNAMDVRDVKYGHMEQLAAYRDSILSSPPLKNLFLELTLRCNENCIHCGSRCTDIPRGGELTTEEYFRLLDQVAADFGAKNVELDITGGEPLLRKDLYEIMAYAYRLGFRWGMTSNATLIDEAAARRLKECGMKTISVSIDGLKATHDRLRGLPGAFDGAVRGVKALAEVGGFQHIQVTTVLNRESFCETDALFELMLQLPIDSWRLVGVEPIGRALEHPELLLTPEQNRRMLDYIRQKRREGYPVLYGCSHYLGADYEREVRDWYFLCTAGLYTASVTSTGDICACLDIERRPELTQGNIRSDRLKDVWEHRFGVFRKDLSELSETCRACSAKRFCHGGAHHTWDYDKNEQRVCLFRSFTQPGP